MKPKLGLWGAMALVLLATPACASHYYVARVPAPPPPPVAAGFVGVAPGAGYLWIDGAWDWRYGRNYWVPGRWVRPPRPRAAWVPGYWAPARRGYYWRRGYWR